MNNLEISFGCRKEHLTATPLPEYVKKIALELEKEEELKREALEDTKKDSSRRFVVANQDHSEEEKKKKQEEEEDEAFKNYKTGYRNIPDYVEEPVEEWKEAKQAFSDYTAFRPSLDPPSPLLLSFQEYTSASLSNEPLHLGRKMDLSDSKTSKFSSTLWMYEPQNHQTDLDTLSLDISKIVSPLLHLVGMGNEHIRSFNAFLDASTRIRGSGSSTTDSCSSLPPGLPVQMEIPIGYGFPLSARIRVHGIDRGQGWREDKDESFWSIPGPKDGYRDGEVISGSAA